MPTSLFLPLMIFQIAAFLGALGQLFYQRSSQIGLSQTSGKSYFVLGVALYVSVTLLFIAAYRLGGQVSVLYPSYATTFVWGLVLSNRMAGEALNRNKWLGTLAVAAGVALVTL